VVTINRAVAISELEGPEAGIAAISGLDPVHFSTFLPFQALMGDLHAKAGDRDAACAAFDRALALGPGDAERRYLQARRAFVDASRA
jgi:RNA polymerase sigma-70 factor, ECF subfamily